MEKYIRLEEEKARRHGRTFNWQTATFGKVKHYEDEGDCSINFETEFPAIVFDNTIISYEPKVCPPNEIKFDFKISLDESDDEDYTRQPWLIYDVEGYTPGIVHSYEQRLKTILSRPVNRVHILDFAGLTLKMRHDLVVWLRIVYFGEGQQRLLGLAPSYVLIRDLVRRLCHMMIAYSISGRGQAPEKATGVDLFYLRSIDCRTANFLHLLAQYLFRHAKRIKNKARLSGVTRELPLIDLHKLGRLHICMRYDDTWAWVAHGPKRQQAAAAGAHEADMAGLVAEEVAEDLPAPPPPPPALQSRIMSQRIKRVEEELMDVSGQTYQPFDRTLIGLHTAYPRVWDTTYRNLHSCVFNCLLVL
nr:hypothetical protein [Tanacetum cinerariifolium]